MDFYTGFYMQFAAPAQHQICLQSIASCVMPHTRIEIVFSQMDSMRHRLPHAHRAASQLLAWPPPVCVPSRDIAATRNPYRATPLRPANSGTNHILTRKLARTLRLEQHFPPVPPVGHVLLPVG
ncbi:unnamed protein product, partial [Sphacelaria rigidula]